MDNDWLMRGRICTTIYILMDGLEGHIYFGSIEAAMIITCMVPLQSFFVLALDFLSIWVNNNRGTTSFDHV